MGWAACWVAELLVVTRKLCHVTKRVCSGVSVADSAKQVTELRSHVQTASRLLGLPEPSGQSGSLISGTSSLMPFVCGLNQLRLLFSIVVNKPCTLLGTGSTICSFSSRRLGILDFKKVERSLRSLHLDFLSC